MYINGPPDRPCASITFRCYAITVLCLLSCSVFHAQLTGITAKHAKSNSRNFVLEIPPPPFCCKRSWRVGIHPANLAVIRNQKIQLPAFQNAESRMVHRWSSTADKYHFNLHPARACTSRSRSNCIRAYPLTYGFFPINPVTKSHNWAFHHWYCLYPI